MEPGKNYKIETTTGMVYVGTLVAECGPHTASLENAAWIAQSGRLHVFMRDGRAEGMEVEPVGEITVHWASWSPWNHELFPEAV